MHCDWMKHWKTMGGNFSVTACCTYQAHAVRQCCTFPTHTKTTLIEGKKTLLSYCALPPVASEKTYLGVLYIWFASIGLESVTL